MTDDTVIEAIRDVLKYIDAFEPMVEVLEGGGVALPMDGVAVGGVLLFTAVTAELVRERALTAEGAVRAALNTRDSDGGAFDLKVLAAARDMVRDAMEALVREPGPEVGRWS